MNVSTIRNRTLAALAACGFAAAGHAAVFIVNNTQDVPDEFPGNGICNPVGAVGNTCTLRAAIMEANALGGSHTVLVASGQYTLTRVGAGEDFASTGDLDIRADITLINGTNNPPVVFAANQDRVFDVHPGASLRLDNVHVAGGYANQVGTVHGAAFRVHPGAALELDRAVVAGNLGNVGGAIYSDGSVSIVDSVFFHNAITATHVLPEFANGAAILSRGSLSIERSTFHDNGVLPGGEGLVAQAHVIHGRDNGPANPEINLVNVTVANNTRGIRSDGVPLEMNMVTIAGNGARGLQFNRDLGALGQVQLRIRQTVIAGHTGGDCNGLNGDDAEYLVQNRHNASSSATCGFIGYSDQENIVGAFLGELADHGGPTPVLMPDPTGPLVDTGGQLCMPSFEDQRGKSRPIDGNLDFLAYCDIGAVEYDPDTDPVPPVADLIFANDFELQ